MITLKTLPQATPQQVFDQVKEHLLKQGRQSMNDEGSCRYLAPNGDKCAAGCLIAGDEYNNEFEGNDWMHLIDLYNVSDNHEDLIDRLQSIHDKVSPLMWEIQLKSVAIDFDLNYE